MKLSHFFLPHPQTHKKAHLISWRATFIYILLFIVLQLSFNVLSMYKPGVLGIDSEVNQKKLIELTNQERAKKGLPTLRENEKLNLAAAAKAANMFEEDYWAHYSPSGKDPWGFINAAGYKFSYAGENLAKNFYKSDDVVSAWMASSTHRDNLLNSRYQEIGIAAVEGVLKGQKTVLIVQEFGRPVEVLADVPVENSNLGSLDNLGGNLTGVSSAIAGQKLSSSAIDPYQVTRMIGLSLVGLFIILLIADIYILRKRAVARVTSSHLPHMALLSVAASALLGMGPGNIL